MTDEEKTTVPAGAETDDEKTTAVEASELSDSETESETDEAEATDEQDAADDSEPDATKVSRVIDWPRVVAYGLLPALALVLALAAGFLKYVDNSVSDSSRAGIESAQAASAGTIAILSYTPDKVEQQLNDARNLLTGDFRDAYTGLINGVVIPGAQQKQISAVATVPGASVVSAQPNHAVVLLFVNQTVVVGADAPTDTASSVRVTLDKVDDKWLISQFEPV